MPRGKDVFIHERALCESDAIGARTRIWAFAHVMGGARIGEDCNVGEGAFVESGARVGDRVTVKNGVQIWDLAPLQILVERGAPVDVVARNEELRVTPLQSAVAAREEETAALLVERGANPNARHEGGFTPLHAAAQHGDEPVVALLLAHGADPTIAADDGRTAADFAREGGHAALVQQLSAG